jgi:tRNA nucleotidyltransferase (CCA-adding enzyme)
VRDALIGKKPKDWDIMTSATPPEMMSAFAGQSVFPTGIKHGTLTVIAGGSPVEVSAYRLPSDADGDAAATMATDLAARDFTLNAIACHPERGIVDVVGGLDDLRAGVIRAVGNPAARFTEDAARVLRALRFAAQYGYRIEDGTARVMRGWGPRLTRVAPERLWREFRLLLCGPYAAETMLKWPDIIGAFVPEILPMVGFDQHSPYHIYDVYEHTLRALEHLPPSPALRLAMLFHDCGKPASFSLDKAGVGHFYGHPRRSEEIARQVLKRLRSTRAERERVCALTRWHDAPITCRKKSVRHWLRQISPKMFRDLLLIKRADCLAQHPDCRSRLSTLDEIGEILREIMAERGCVRLADLAVNGDDLLALGIPQGRAVGRALDALLWAVTEGKCANERQALLGLAGAHAGKTQPNERS